LGVTICAMAVAGVLIYSSWQQMNAPNRRSVCIVGLVLGGTAELCGIIGLVGLARFSDTDKIPFKLGYWINLIQLWAYTGYIWCLLYVWDGKLKSGTTPMPTGITTSATEAANAAKGLVSMVEISTEVHGTPLVGPGSTASTVWFQILDTQIWFMGLTAALILLSLLYAYGSLRLKCKRMGKWGTTMTGFLLMLIALGTMFTGSWAIYKNFRTIDWRQMLPVYLQLALALLIFATTIYEMYVATQVAKLKLAAKGSITTVLILAWVAALSLGDSYYTFYQALRIVPRIETLYLTALFGIASQILLFIFGVQLIAWRYSLMEEYPILPGAEKFSTTGDEAEAFLPPSDHPNGQSESSS